VKVVGIFDFLKKNKATDEINLNEENLDNAADLTEEVAESAEMSDNAITTGDTEKAETAAEEIQAVTEKTELDKELDESTKTKEQYEGENPEVQENVETEPENIAPTKESLFSKIKTGLKKTRDNLMSGVESVLKSFTTIDEELYEELEEALIMADIGVETSVEIIERLRERVKIEKVHEVSEVKGLIIKIISEMLKEDKTELVLSSPSVILVIGVNGVGKTTTIGKLANNYKKQGKSVILAAADTFRAAAIDQLEVWGERNGVSVIKHQENSDPGAVVFDAVQSAKAKNADILICDTAGRLHNKKNLMDELAKIFKIIAREYPNAQQEVFLVLDATTGQNALQQAKLFKEVANITGLVLTKLDGTAKGGIIIAIKNELKIPVRYIGVGEGIDDLQPFDEDDFAEALFAE
jgi:fused signal recognition particle receptor